MAEVVVYSSMFCPYCAMAKRLLDAKGVTYREIAVDWKAGERAAMRERAGGRSTVPQVFIGERHVGGFDDLSALDASGELDRLLAEAT